MYDEVKRTASQVFFRWLFYLLGMTILSLGIMLNTNSGLGVSPIISIPYVCSIIGGFDFGNASLVAYVVLAAVEYALKGSRFRVYDLLQIPLSVALTRLFDVFGALLPAASGLPEQVACLAFGVAFTGIGAAMTLNERLVPNPGDGIVQAISDRVGKPVGLCKNCFDVFCILLCIGIGAVSTGHVVGIGAGTVAAVICVGRFMAIYNHFFAQPTMRLAGMVPVRG